MVKDVNGNVITEYDLSLGYLTEESEIVHHDAVEGIEEVGHWKTVAEYPNGGKDVTWVIDVQGVAACEAYDEQVPYQTYTPYTPEELARRQPTLEEQIAELQEQIELLMSGATQ